MPNVGILKDLFEQTKGRKLIMNTADLLFDRNHGTTIDEKLPQYRKKMSATEKAEFHTNLRETEHFFELKFPV